ncbi:MAG: AAA family ATPase [Myxococcota bacterium]
MSRSFLTPSGTVRRRVLEGTPHDILSEVPESWAERLVERDVPETTLAIAEEASRWPLNLGSHDRPALVLLLVALLVELRQGSSFLPLERSRVAASLESLGFLGAERERCLELLRRILHDPSAFSGLIGTAEGAPILLAKDPTLGPVLLPATIAAKEARLRSALATRLEARPVAPPEEVARVLEDLSLRPTRRGAELTILGADQRTAVGRALSLGMVLISGGPGTGKTSIAVSILRGLARQGIRPERIALAAPTGKAAERLTRSVATALASIADPSPEDRALQAAELSASTIHRLLAFQPSTGRFGFGERVHLPIDALILDEGSMIDLPLMDRVLAAAPAGARLVILGDSDQLPSVDVGAVFRDLVQAGGDRAVRLTESYRMSPSDPAGRAILAAAAEINAGNAEGTRRAIPEGKGPISRSAGPLEAFLESWVDTHFARGPELQRLVSQTYHLERGVLVAEEQSQVSELYRYLASRRVLTVTRGLSRPTGQLAVNQRLRELVSKQKAAEAGAEFLPGEPVLAVVNDYARELYNGDFGVVLKMSDLVRPGEPQLYAVFEKGERSFVCFPIGALRTSLELSYAMTVHKAQGSELDHLALILPEIPLPILTREILYTAVTRARRSVLIHGSEAVLRAGVERRLLRFSGLAW